MRPNVPRGFTLLEVLIALLVFSLGLMGLAGLMVLSVKTNNSAYLRTQASFMAQSMADRMRANLGQIPAYVGNYSATTIAGDSCITASCAPLAIAARDKSIWSTQLVAMLPNPRANIACTGASLSTTASTSGAATYNGLCTLTIKWTEATLERTASAGAPPDQTFAWVFQP